MKQLQPWATAFLRQCGWSSTRSFETSAWTRSISSKARVQSQLQKGSGTDPTTPPAVPASAARRRDDTQLSSGCQPQQQQLQTAQPRAHKTIHSQKASAIDAVLAAIAAGHRRVLVRMPCQQQRASVAAAVAAAVHAQDPSHRQLLLAEGPQHMATLREELAKVLPGSSIATLPGAPLQAQQALVLADSRHLAASKHATQQLQQHKHALCLAIAEESPAARPHFGTTATAVHAHATDPATAAVLAQVTPGATAQPPSPPTPAGAAQQRAAAAALQPTAGPALSRGTLRVLQDLSFLAASSLAPHQRLLLLSDAFWDAERHVHAARIPAARPDAAMQGNAAAHATAAADANTAAYAHATAAPLASPAAAQARAKAPPATASSGTSHADAAAAPAGGPHIAYEVFLEAGIESGLLTPLVAQQLHTGTSLDASLLCAISNMVAGISGDSSGSSSSSSGSSSSNSSNVSSSSSSGSSGGSDSSRRSDMAGTEPHASATRALSSALSNPQRSDIIVKCLAAILPKWGRCLAYAADANHARALAIALNMQGLSALVLHEHHTPEEREAVLLAFLAGQDAVLVTSVPLDDVAAVGGLPTVDMVLLASPALGRAEYVRRLAPALLHAHGKEHCLVLDCVDAWQNIPATVSPAVSPAAAPTESPAAAGYTASVEAAVLTADGLTSGDPTSTSLCSHGWVLRCNEVLPMVQQLPAVQAMQTHQHAPSNSGSSSGSEGAAAAAAANALGTEAPSHSSSSRASTSKKTSSSSGSNSSSSIVDFASQPGELNWVTMDDGSFGIPLMEGSRAKHRRVVWLRPEPKGWVPEVEGHDQQRQSLQPEGAKPTSLGKARLIAEAWLKQLDSMQYALRRTDADWRDKPMSDNQASFLVRHSIPHDASWTRGRAGAAMDAHVLQAMRVPASDEQQFYLRHLSAYWPRHLRPTTGTTAYARAAEAAIANALHPGGMSQPLPARQAVLHDLQRLWVAGLRPKYGWVGVGGVDWVLDLLSGSYLWLRHVGVPDGRSGGSGSSSSRGDSSSRGSSSDGGSSSGRGAGASPHAAPATAGAGASAAATAAAGAAAAARAAAARTAAAGAAAGATACPPMPLDPRALYSVTLQQPDGTEVAVLFGRHKSGPQPMPLALAMERAEKHAAALARQQQAALSLEAVTRVVSMIAGWRLSSSAQDVVALRPASSAALDALREAGLPANRRYTALDAHRELLRHSKALGLLEPPATPSQLARIAELQLQVPEERQGQLTYAEARWLIYLAAARVEEGAKKAIKDKLKARPKKSYWRR